MHVTDEPPPTYDVLGTPLRATNYRNLIAYCHRLVQSPGTYALDFSNTHIVTLRRHDPSFYESTSRFDLFIPDGMPLIWCLNQRGARLNDRVYGPTFMRMCISESPAPFTHYFLGGSSECVNLLKEKFRAIDPAIQIVGTRDGYFSANEEKQIVDEINQLRPDFVWIGLGTPKQQEWIYRNKAAIKHGLLLAVGFAFDVNAGMKRDAPPWMQTSGLTWLFRILSEPKRLTFRYIRYNSLFLFYLVKDWLTKAQAAKRS
jgi:N-acetylglucosaminyldiphosphoundecaprenol N-acetyl-beta-D-mannosaminyltransferase